jgi:plastocyanin
VPHRAPRDDDKHNQESAVRKSVFSGVVAGFVLIVASACGGGGTASQVPAPSAARSAAAASTGTGAATCSAGIATGQQVGIANFAFTPATISVSAGTPVSWTNADAATHTITFDNGPDCGRLNTAASTSVTFAAAGTYNYHCSIHPSMRGTVTVS